MPIYEYKCRRCGAVFDLLRGLRDDDRDVECPQCRQQDAERLISLTASDLLSSAGDSCGSSGFR